MQERPLTIQEICKKLKPVLGRKVEVLFMNWTFAEDPERKREAEQMIQALYLKYLKGDLLEEAILLEPPAEDVVQGAIPLGVISYANKDLYPFSLRDQDLVRHVCITGMSGSGKTNLAFQVLQRLGRSGKPYLVFDWKKSFRPLVAADPEVLVFTIGNEACGNFFRTNINRPPRGVSPKEWILILADIINEAFFASHGVHKLVSETLDQAFRDFKVYEGSDNYPTWRQIKDRLEDKSAELKHRGRESEWVTSALRIAHALTFGSFGDAVCHKGPDAMTVEDALGKKVVFELFSLNVTEKKFFCEYVLTYLYKLKKANYLKEHGGFQQAILVDEAHNIFLKERTKFLHESITDMIYREIREYGVGLICLDQHISRLSDTVAGNSACLVAFQQFLPPDVDAIAGIMQLGDKKQFFSMLPVGAAIIRLAERYPHPFLIKVPLAEQYLRDVSDDAILRHMAPRMRRFGLLRAVESCREENLSRARSEHAALLRRAGVAGPVEGAEPFAHAEQEARIVLDTPLTKHFEGEWSREDLSFLEKDPAIRNNPQHMAARLPHNLTLTEFHRRFLEAVQRSPRVPVSELYARLDLSGRKGNQLKEELLYLDLVEAEEVRDERGWRKYLRLTPKGRDALESPPLIV